MDFGRHLVLLYQIWNGTSNQAANFRDNTSVQYTILIGMLFTILGFIWSIKTYYAFYFLHPYYSYRKKKIDVFIS